MVPVHEQGKALSFTVVSKPRKRMVRLLIEDVNVVKRDRITRHVRLRGGAKQSLTLPAPLDAWHLRRTCDSTVEEIDKLLDNHTRAEIVAILNSKGLQTRTGMPFTADVVDRLIHGRKLRSRQTRLRPMWYLTLPEAAVALGSSTSEVRRCRNGGSLVGLRYGVSTNRHCTSPAIILRKVSQYETQVYRRYQWTHKTMISS
jgi:hypothetical protein